MCVGWLFVCGCVWLSGRVRDWLVGCLCGAVVAVDVVVGGVAVAVAVVVLLSVCSFCCWC